MTLTTEYQYIGRSNAMKPKSGDAYWYYILLYAKSTPNSSTGYHTVTIKQELVCTVLSRFWGRSTSYHGTVDGISAFSGTNMPNKDWDTLTPFVAGGITYKAGTVIGEGSVAVNCTDGAEHTVPLSVSWSLLSSPAGETYLPLANTTATVSVSVTLPAIARATTLDAISCSSAYLDGVISYSYTPKSDSYYNVARILCGAMELQTILIGVKSAQQQTGSVSLSADDLELIYGLVTSSVSCDIAIEIDTYSDSALSAQIGDTQRRTIALKIPESVKPSASLTVAPVNTNEWIAAKGIYVRGLSGLTAHVTGAPGEGASISGYHVHAVGLTWAAGDSLTIDSLWRDGTFSVEGTVTDSRQRATVDSKTVTVHPYSSPAVSSVQYERGSWTDGEWTESEDGEDIKVIYKLRLSLSDFDNRGAVTFKFNGQAVIPSAGTYTDIQNNAEVFAIFTGIDSEKTWRCSAAVTDSAGTTSGALSFVVPSKSVAIEYRASGKGIAFGKTSEKDGLECAWDADFSGTTLFSGSVTGNVLSIGKLPYIAAYSDFNDYTTPGVYGVYYTLDAQTISNLPGTVKDAGTLRVYCSTGNTAQDGRWVYLMQEYVTMYGDAVYRRGLSNLNDDGWQFTAWKTFAGT